MAPMPRALERASVYLETLRRVVARAKMRSISLVLLTPNQGANCAAGNGVDRSWVNQVTMKKENVGIEHQH